MENETSLELSLGLACGGTSSTKPEGGSLDLNVAEVGTGKTSASGNFNVLDASFGGLHTTSNINAENHIRQQRRHENFWTSLGKGTQSYPEKDGLPWGLDSREVVHIGYDKSGSSKRTLPLEDTTLQKKLAMGRDHIDTRVSINIEDDSPAEIEDVAKSEAEVRVGSSSWLFPRHEEHNTTTTSRSSSAPKFSEKPFFNNLDLFGSQVKHQTQSSSLGLEEVNGTAAVCNLTAFPSHSIMQLMPLSDDKQSGVQPYVQLPVLENGSPGMLTSRTRIGQSYDRSSTMGGSTGANSKASQSHVAGAGAGTSRYEGKILDLTKESKEDVNEHSQIEDGSNANKSVVGRTKLVSNQAVIEGMVCKDSSTITPGVASHLQFKGNGSCPDLPWVSTTAPVPNGKTISGVTYKLSNQTKIVCACHGSHMSPEEFIQHASDKPSNNKENNTSSTQK